MSTPPLKAFEFEIHDIPGLRAYAESEFKKIDMTVETDTSMLGPIKVLTVLTLGMGNPIYVWMAAKSQLTTPKFTSHPYNALVKIYSQTKDLTPAFWQLIRALHKCEPSDLRTVWEKETAVFLEASQNHTNSDLFKRWLTSN